MSHARMFGVRVGQIGGIACPILLLLCGIQMAGAGHGPGFFGAIAICELPLSLIAAVLVSRTDGRVARRVFLCLMAILPVLALLILGSAGAEAEHFARRGHSLKTAAVYFGSFNLLGQAMLWGAFLLVNRRFKISLGLSMIIMLYLVIQVATIAIPVRWAGMPEAAADEGGKLEIMHGEEP